MHTGFHRRRRVVSAIVLGVAAGLIAGTAPAAAQDGDFAPVTDAMLQDPADLGRAGARARGGGSTWRRMERSSRGCCSG